MSIQTGTLVKIWHNGRGHDYVVGCLDHDARRVGLVRNNCINTDGSIHAATARAANMHKWIPYHELGEQRIVPSFTRIIGDREIDTRAMYDALVRPYAIETGHNVSVVLPEHNLFNAVQDNRASVTY